MNKVKVFQRSLAYKALFGILPDDVLLLRHPLTEGRKERAEDSWDRGESFFSVGGLPKGVPGDKKALFCLSLSLILRLWVKISFTYVYNKSYIRTSQQARTNLWRKTLLYNFTRTYILTWVLKYLTREEKNFDPQRETFKTRIFI